MPKSECKTQRIKGKSFGEMPRVAFFSSLMRDFLKHFWNIMLKKKNQFNLYLHSDVWWQK